MKRIEYKVTNYHLETLRIFLSRAEIGKRMMPPVSPAMVQHWEKGTSFMNEADFKRLESVILNLATEFKKSDHPFKKQLGTLLQEAAYDAPKIEYRPDKRSTSAAVDALAERLVTLLHGKTRRSTHVIETLVEEGWSAAQVQRVAKMLGVRKNPKGFGPNMKSYWSLKK